MGDGGLSGTQRLIRRLSSPELFAAMERDSRLWKGECPHCRAQTSLWEIGGVRYKAIGEPLTRLLTGVLSNNARIVTESDKRNPLELGFPLEFERDYGDTRIRIHRD
jgi:hypothetical protein